MAAPTVSIIIPAYCCTDLMRVCLDSIRAQTFSDFEAVVVEDNSPDKGATLAVAREYAGRDGRFRVLRTPVNGGKGPACNVGLDAARGEYVSIVDADDVLSPLWLEHLVALALKYDADYVNAPYARLYADGSLKGDVGDGAEEVTTDRTVIADMALNIFADAPGREPYPASLRQLCGSLIRRGMIDRGGVRFPPVPHMISEDYPFIYGAVRLTRVHVRTPRTYYHYREVEGSLTRSPRPDILKRAEATTRYYLDLLKADGHPASARGIAYGFYLASLRGYLKLIFGSDWSEPRKREWFMEECGRPIVAEIDARYPWRRLPLKHRLHFALLLKRRYRMLHALVMGQEWLRKRLR